MFDGLIAEKFLYAVKPFSGEDISKASEKIKDECGGSWEKMWSHYRYDHSYDETQGFYAGQYIRFADFYNFLSGWKTYQMIENPYYKPGEEKQAEYLKVPISVDYQGQAWF